MIGLLRIVLLALKIIGVVLSATSLIGSERLARTETWLYNHTAKESIRGKLESLFSTKGFAVSEDSVMEVGLGIAFFIIFGSGYFLFSLDPIRTVSITCIYLILVAIGTVLFLMIKNEKDPANLIGLPISVALLSPVFIVFFITIFPALLAEYSGNRIINLAHIIGIHRQCDCNALSLV